MSGESALEVAAIVPSGLTQVIQLAHEHCSHRGVFANCHWLSANQTQGTGVNQCHYHLTCVKVTAQVNQLDWRLSGAFLLSPTSISPTSYRHISYLLQVYLLSHTGIYTTCIFPIYYRCISYRYISNRYISYLLQVYLLQVYLQ